MKKTIATLGAVLVLSCAFVGTASAMLAPPDGGGGGGPYPCGPHVSEKAPCTT